MTVIALIILVAAVWVFFTLGRGRRPECDCFYGSLVAHRGLHNGADRPENSLAAFDAAASAGYGIELDVHLAADGEAVVFHDGNIKRMTGEDVKLSSLTADQLKTKKLLSSDQYIPRFSEVLDTVSGRVPLVVELKCETADDPAPLCEKVSAMMDEYVDKTGGGYSVESFNPYVVKWFRKNRPDVFRGQLSGEFFKKGKRNFTTFIMEYLWVNYMGRPDFVAFDHRRRGSLSFRIWKGIYRAPYAYWTIRSEKELDLLLLGGKRGCYIFEGFTPSKDKLK